MLLYSLCTRRASNRDKKLSVDSPPSSSERGGQDDDKTEKHLTTTSFHPVSLHPLRAKYCEREEGVA